MVFGQVTKDNYEGMKSLLPGDFEDSIKNKNYLCYAAFGREEDFFEDDIKYRNTKTGTLSVAGTVTVSLYENDAGNYGVVNWLYIHPGYDEKEVVDFIYDELIETLPHANVEYVFTKKPEGADEKSLADYASSQEALIYESEDMTYILPRFFGLESMLGVISKRYKATMDADLGPSYIIPFRSGESVMVFIVMDHDNKESFSIGLLAKVPVGDSNPKEVIRRFEEVVVISQADVEPSGESYDITAFLPCEDGLPGRSEMASFYDTFTSEVVRFFSLVL